MKKIKAGIVTFHYAHNYGAMLQAFAIRKFLIDTGVDAEIVNYVPSYMELKYFKKNIIEIFLTFRRSIIRDYYKRINNIKKFEHFEKNELGINSKKIGKKNLSDVSQQYDWFIFGSDQIWNTNITKNDLSYFGDFICGNNKISYAASSGNALESENYKKMAVKYLFNFNAISVRENNAKIILSKLLNREVVKVLDPVFLLNRNIWIKQSNKSLLSLDNNYILYYAIQKNDFLEAECNRYANDNGLEVYTVHGEMKKMNSESRLLDDIGPNEFLYLVKNAKAIFTNSFHAVAFSIIFDKEAYVRVHSETGNRVVDLINECGFDWDGLGLFELNKGNYESLKNIIKMSREFLLNNLSIQ